MELTYVAIPLTYAAVFLTCNTAEHACGLVSYTLALVALIFIAVGHSWSTVSLTCIAVGNTVGLVAPVRRKRHVSHVHLIVGTETGILSDIVRDFKSFTSRHIRIAIGQSEQESRREWILEIFNHAGTKNERNIDFQFWQQHNHPIELSNSTMLKQRLDYIHNNPVEAGFVEKTEEWLHSSAGDYYGTRKGRIELVMVE